MGNIESRLWNSAFDFHRAVVPFLANWLPDGYFLGVEDAPDHPAVRVLDLVAGIDAWYVSAGSTWLAPGFGSTRYESAGSG